MANILLAEDSPTQVIMLKSILEDEGYRVTVATDGKQAYDLAVQDAPDVIVTDMQMPRMDGLELVKRLTADAIQIPVILITAEGSEELAVKALQEGATAYLPKSMVDEELISTVEHVLGLMHGETSYKRLLDCMDHYEFQFTLDSDVNLVNPLVHLMQDMATGVQVCDDVARTRLGIALEQAFLNAIYHGNLEISHQQQVQDEEFSVEGESSLYDQRRSDPEYANKKVFFHSRLAKDKIVFTVRDEGKGFDTSQIPPREDPHLLDGENGKGLVLIQSFMDEVSFNSAGNEIVMTKCIDQSAAVEHSDGNEPTEVVQTS